MRKTNLIMEFSTEFGLSKKEAKTMLDWVEDQIVDGVRSGDEVVLDIGKFKLKQTPARTGRNPRTGEKMHIKAKTKPVFRASKKFQERILD